MQCEKCHAELPPNSISCPECGAPAPQTIEGFDNTQHIQLQLKMMFKEYAYMLFLRYEGSLMFHEKRFIALLNDFTAEYDKERKLLRSMIEEGLMQAIGSARVAGLSENELIDTLKMLLTLKEN